MVLVLPAAISRLVSPHSTPAPYRIAIRILQVPNIKLFIIVSSSPVFLQIATVRLFIYRMVKRVRRLLSGNCEIARICGETRESDRDSVATLQPHTPEMTALLLTEWRSSAKLTPLYRDIGTSADMQVDDAVTAICAVKHISPSAPWYVCRSFLIICWLAFVCFRVLIVRVLKFSMVLLQKSILNDSDMSLNAGSHSPVRFCSLTTVEMCAAWIIYERASKTSNV